MHIGKAFDNMIDITMYLYIENHRLLLKHLYSSLFVRILIITWFCLIYGVSHIRWSNSTEPKIALQRDCSVFSNNHGTNCDISP